MMLGPLDLFAQVILNAVFRGLTLILEHLALETLPRLAAIRLPEAGREEVRRWCVSYLYEVRAGMQREDRSALAGQLYMIKRLWSLPAAALEMRRSAGKPTEAIEDAPPLRHVESRVTMPYEVLAGASSQGAHQTVVVPAIEVQLPNGMPAFISPSDTVPAPRTQIFPDYSRGESYTPLPPPDEQARS